MSKHTSGPWEAVYNGSSSWSIGQAEEPQELPPYVIINDRNDDRARANARLIAAAPDLLRDAQELENAICGVCAIYLSPDNKCYDRQLAEAVQTIRATIAKAEAPNNA